MGKTTLLQEIDGSRNMRVKYCCDAKAYENYYLSQVGHGIPYFAGAGVQQGYGLGNLFCSIAKRIFCFGQKRCQNPWNYFYFCRLRILMAQTTSESFFSSSLSNIGSSPEGRRLNISVLLMIVLTKFQSVLKVSKKKGLIELNDLPLNLGQVCQVQAV